MEVAETGEEALERGDSPNIQKDSKEKKKPNKITFDKETEYLKNGEKEVEILKKNTVFAQEVEQNAQDVHNFLKQVQRQNMSRIINEPVNFKPLGPEEADTLLHSCQQSNQHVQDCAIGTFNRTPYPYTREGERRSPGRPRGEYHDPETKRKKELERQHKAKSTAKRIKMIHKMRNDFEQLDGSFEKFTRMTSESIKRATAVADRLKDNCRDPVEMERYLLNCALGAIAEIVTALKTLKNWYGSPPKYPKTVSPYSSVSFRKKKNTSKKTADLDNANSDGAAGNSTIGNKDEQNLIQRPQENYAFNTYPPQGDIYQTLNSTKHTGYPENNVKGGFVNSASNTYPPQGDIYQMPEWTSQAKHRVVTYNPRPTSFTNRDVRMAIAGDDRHHQDMVLGVNKDSLIPLPTVSTWFPPKNGSANYESSSHQQQVDNYQTLQSTGHEGHVNWTTQHSSFHNPPAWNQSPEFPLTMGGTEPLPPVWRLDNESDNASLHYANRATQHFGPQYYRDQQLAPGWINAGDETSGENKTAIVSNPYDELSE